MSSKDRKNGEKHGKRTISSPVGVSSAEVFYEMFLRTESPANAFVR